MKDISVLFFFYLLALSCWICVLSVKMNFKSKAKTQSLLDRVSLIESPFNLGFTSIKTKLFLKDISLLNKSSTEFFAVYSLDNDSITITSDPKLENNHKVIAQATYLSDISQVGWRRLHIKTLNDEDCYLNSLLQCYTSGYLEGAITHTEIYQYHVNAQSFLQDLSKESFKRLHDIYEIMYESIVHKINNDEISKITDTKERARWNYYLCIISQLDGLYAGYNSNYEADTPDNISKRLTIVDFLILNSSGNFGDIKSIIDISDSSKYKVDETTDFSSKENLEKLFGETDIISIYKKLLKNSHCSVIAKLIKQQNGEYDIISGHDTWSSYSELIRTLKTYNYEFDSKCKNKNDTLIPKPKKISMSSYPGVLFSGDDFYVLESGLTLLQTTLNVLDRFKYYNLIDFSNYIPEFIRLMTINFLSNTGEEWVENYKDSKNHLYITQWVIVDYNQLSIYNANPLDSNKKGVIHVLEEVPNEVFIEDISEKFFVDGYFGSFNYPYFDKSFQILGYSKFQSLKEKRNDPWINSRQFILEKLHTRIYDIESFIKIISYNGYKNPSNDFEDDPSLNDPSNGMMARYDLFEIPEYFGGIDYKVLNHEYSKELKFEAKLGPTTSNPHLPVLVLDIPEHNWRKKYFQGIPTRIDFNQITFKPLY